MTPTLDNSVRDGNTGRLIRIESKLTRLMLHFGIDERGKEVERLTPCQMHDFDFPTEKQS